MVVLPTIPCSCSKLLPVCRATANPPTSHYQPKDHHQRRLRETNNNNDDNFSRDLSLRTTLFADQVLIKEDDHPLKMIKRSDDEGLKKEVANVIMRLHMVVERIREMEIQKKFITSRSVKGQVSCDLAEEMSRDIVGKFLEKPIQYLTSDQDGDMELEEKLKDVNILVAILENSCPPPIRVFSYDPRSSIVDL